MAPVTEHFLLPPTSFVPNNVFPVIVYRHVFPQPFSEESTTEFLQANKWEKKGFWPAVPTHHFHQNTHECYGVVRGTSSMLLGRGQLDGPAGGRLISLAPGDVIVIPAGVSHMNVDFTDDYRYVGVYPIGSPKWRSERCDNPEILEALHEEI
ncbi:hypothetical protein BX600DRAFT_518478 [Xylariales sp. PMI_506]|nr:hypothetical protein BX600DRAFT_518478 [Xylariales sp. PMI_506]